MNNEMMSGMVPGEETFLAEEREYYDYGADVRAAPPIDREQVVKAGEILREYKSAKEVLEARILDEERWFQRRQYDHERKLRAMEEAKKNRTDPENAADLDAPTSAWLFNSICNKHADAMDNYPMAVCLPRERSDERDAECLSDIIPVVVERNNFEQTYSDAEWYKLKHGMAVYGVFWDSSRENGLGDIMISRIDVLNLFWQPGIDDIQKSRNLFIVGLEDKEALAAKYPQFDPEEEHGSSHAPIDLAEYVHEGNPHINDDYVLVVDWYYKVYTPDGRTLLHFCKFTGETVLFSSENDPAYAYNGWYAHGEYPVVTDILYPMDGSCEGFGLIAVGRNPQTYIDRLDRNILRYLDEASRVRYWAKKSLGVNPDDFNDLDKRIIEVEGDIDEEKLRQVVVNPMDATVVSVKQLKIDELKETTGARDVSQGSTSGGVTAAAAIAALQEAGNKTSRDSLSSSYRAYVRVIGQVIELIRQFYDEARSFRITGKNGSGYSFVEFSNAGIKDKPTGRMDMDGEEMYRRPIFDIDVKAAKMNPYNQLSQNEIMKELYGMGTFNPQNAQQAQVMLSGMNFDGVEQVREYVSQGATLENRIMQLAQLVAQLLGVPPEAVTALLDGQGGAVSGVVGMAVGEPTDLAKALSGGLDATRTDYGQALAERARANASDTSAKRTEVGG